MEEIIELYGEELLGMVGGTGVITVFMWAIMGPMKDMIAACFTSMF